jgi:peptide/nickel transport system substrate-binding protein/microcin C transport system substrate-binding protein
MKNHFNFKTITIRIVKEESVAFEMLKKGEIDFMELTAEQYVQKAKGPEWGKKLIKEQVENKQPKGYGYIGWNLRKPLLQDKEVRQALAMLINRPLMNEKFRYNMSLLQAGPIYISSEYANPNIKPVPFDPKRALEILKSKGWDDKDQNGVLEKQVDGKSVEFRLTLLTASEDSMKYMTMIKEEAKKIGVDLELRVLEWSSFMKLIDEEKFDAVALSWGAGTVNVDPKQVWHSSSAVKGGSNFVGYKSPEADKLIDQARSELDKKKRITILHKFCEIVANDNPYAWLFSPKYIFYAHTSKVKKAQPTLAYGIGRDTWWVE